MCLDGGDRSREPVPVEIAMAEMVSDELIRRSNVPGRPTDVLWCGGFSLGASVEDRGDRVRSQVDTEFGLEAADDLIWRAVVSTFWAVASTSSTSAPAQLAT
jgi:hypothetical protein